MRASTALATAETAREAIKCYENAHNSVVHVITINCGATCLPKCEINAEQVPRSLTVPLLPTVELGGKMITRLICGGNPLSGYSHVSSDLDRKMIEYYTMPNIQALLNEC